MADQGNISRNWLVAAWPGMGNVAVIAAGYLAQRMGMKPVSELPAKGRFDIQAVEVRQGMVLPPRLPRSLIFKPEQGGPAVFVGEAQPSLGSYVFAQELVDRAKELGIDRIVTFASMASQLHPTEHPRVHGAATTPEMLDELRRIEVHPLEQGQIGGLNGVVLGAAAERGIPAMCLMGEIPFFAAGVPNPKAAGAVLESFSHLAGIAVDLEPLSAEIERMDGVLMQMMERLQNKGGDETDESGIELPGETESGEHADEPAEPHIDRPTRQRIESLFEEAIADRTKAVALKQELDRLGVFGAYENRFLDLFRRAD